VARIVDDSPVSSEQDGGPVSSEQDGGPVSPEEFAALYRQHRSPLLWHLRCLGASQAEAADAVQDAFAFALRDGRRVRDRRAWPAWLRTVAVRCYLRSLAGRGGPRVSMTTVAEVPDTGPAGRSPDSDVPAQEFVLSLLAALPPQQRVFALHYEGWTAAEIGAHLGIDHAAVRQNISRARAALRNALARDQAWMGEP
jgi:RNA polymerase sigma factor (sigma-70 family)